jgi:hypothetical protein
MEFEKRISFGNIIEIGVLVVAMVGMFLSYQAKIDQISIELQREQSQRMRHAEQVERTYVRKDVMDVILVQLKEIKDELKEIKKK